MNTPQSPGGLPPAQEVNLNTAPVPESPQDIQVPEEVMRAEIESKLAELKARSGALESRNIVSENTSRERKIDLLKEVFAKMQEAGVDFNDPEGVKAFLEMLSQKNPDLYTLFENAMSELLPDKPQEVAPEVVTDGPNLMNKYSNLQDQVLRG